MPYRDRPAVTFLWVQAARPSVDGTCKSGSIGICLVFVVPPQNLDFNTIPRQAAASSGMFDVGGWGQGEHKFCERERRLNTDYFGLSGAKKA